MRPCADEYLNSIKGKGKTGGSPFQGNCNFCGSWGHRKSECKKLDRFMQGKGPGRDGGSPGSDGGWKGAGKPFGPGFMKGGKFGSFGKAGDFGWKNGWKPPNFESPGGFGIGLL